MVKSGSKSSPKHFSESPSQESEFEAVVQDVANQVTKRQYKLASELLSKSKERNYSEELLIEHICILMASSFREGINLALQTYGLLPAPAAGTPIPVHAVGD